MHVEAGADIVDVNVGGKGVDEVTVLPEAVRVVEEEVDLPLSIDTHVQVALEGLSRPALGQLYR